MRIKMAAKVSSAANVMKDRQKLPLMSYSNPVMGMGNKRIQFCRAVVQHHFDFTLTATAKAALEEHYPPPKYFFSNFFALPFQSLPPTNLCDTKNKSASQSKNAVSTNLKHSRYIHLMSNFSSIHFHTKGCNVHMFDIVDTAFSY